MPNLNLDEKKLMIEDRLRYLMFKSPGMAALAVWVPHNVVEAEGTAATDGKQCMYFDGFFKMSGQEQLFVIAHEILHVALRHIPRSQKVRKKNLREYNHSVMNIAQDAVINLSLSEQSWMKFPACGGIKIDEVVPRAELERKAAVQWTSEEIYALLMKQQPKVEVLQILGPSGSGGKPSPSKGSPGDQGEQEQVKGGGGGRARVRVTFPNGKKIETEIDLDMDKDGESGESEENEALQDGIWQRRMERAQAGDKSDGILRKFQGEVPKTKTPWFVFLRDYLNKALRPEVTPSYSRPHRRFIAGAYPFYAPGYVHERTCKQVAFIIDTSGSIGEPDLTRFLSEIAAVQKMTGSELRVIAADCEVKTDQVYSSCLTDVNVLAKKISKQLKGGGGTDFRPALDLLAKRPPDIAIYLTDFYGPCHDKAPNFPVIWALTTEEKPKWGKVLHLDDFNGFKRNN